MSRPEEINADNCRVLLAAFMDENEVGSTSIARAIRCSNATLARILAGITRPTPEFIKHSAILIDIGFDRFKKLSDSQKETISEKIGAIAGGGIGFGSISAAIGASGAAAGLSGAGITSGLAALGSLLGGGMAAGAAVTAAIPIAAGTVGYTIIKGVKFFFSERELNDEKVDPKWEERR